VPLKLDEVAIEVSELVKRTSKMARGIVPASAKQLTAALDIRKYLCHWVVVGWGEGATGHVVDYGRIEVATDDLGLEQAVMVALREFRNLIQTGWPREGNEKEMVIPPQAWIDAGYMTPVVYEFSRQAGNRFVPCVGRGASQQRQQWYNRPTQTGSTVKLIAKEFHINHLPAERLHLVEINADFWKTWTHQRLTQPLDQPGAITFFDAPREIHLAIAKHLTAERKTEEFIAGKGVVTKWERIRKQNHWLDALYLAGCAGYYAGARLVDEHVPAKRPTRSLAQMAAAAARSDGRPCIDRERWHGIGRRQAGMA
jgi:phage terminase large subunit GpA-like protein